MNLSFFISSIFLIVISQSAMALEGIYEVPVDNSASQNFMYSISLSRQGENLNLSYQLPEDLVGTPYPMISMNFLGKFLTHQGYKYKFASQKAQAECLGQMLGLKCHVQYTKVLTNRMRKSEFLRLKYRSQDTLIKNKVNVMLAFTSDPIGILYVFCSKPGCGI